MYCHLWIVVIVANIWLFGLGGPVFILATLLSLNENLTGARGGGISWNLVLSPGKGCTTLGGALRGSPGTYGLPLSTPLAEC